MMATLDDLAVFYRDLRATAYHEAGHAVARVELRLPFRGISIEESAHSSGEIFGSRRSFRIDPGGRSSGHYRAGRDYVERHIISTFAGPEAERRHRRRRRLDATTASGDLAGVAELSLRIEGTGERAQAFSDWLYLETKDAVAAWWPDIKAVARELYRRDFLSAREVKQVMADDRRRRSARRMRDLDP